MAAATRKMFVLGLGDQVTRSELTPARIIRHHIHECEVMQCLHRFKVYSTASLIDTLPDNATMDLAMENIQESLLNATRLGQKQFNYFFQETFIFSKN